MCLMDVGGDADLKDIVNDQIACQEHQRHAQDAATAGRKKSKRTRNGASVTGMAWANLGRNKKRTVTVICSLTLGLVLLSCFYAKNVANT